MYKHSNTQLRHTFTSHIWLLAGSALRVTFIIRNVTRENQHARELISAEKTSHKHNNKDLSRLLVTLTWHACKYKVHKLHHRHILKEGRPPPPPPPPPPPQVAYIPYISGTLGDTGVHRLKTEPIFIQDRT